MLKPIKRQATILLQGSEVQLRAKQARTQALISLQVFNCRNVHAELGTQWLTPGLQQKITFEIIMELV